MKNTYYKDKTCWITGASSGIGAALAYALNKAGAYVIVSSRNRECVSAPLRYIPC